MKFKDQREANLISEFEVHLPNSIENQDINVVIILL